MMRFSKRLGVAVLLAVLAVGAAGITGGTDAQFAIGAAAQTRPEWGGNESMIYGFFSNVICTGYAAAAGYAFGFWPGVAVSGGCGLVMWG